MELSDELMKSKQNSSNTALRMNTNMILGCPDSSVYSKLISSFLLISSGRDSQSCTLGYIEGQRKPHKNPF